MPSRLTDGPDMRPVPLSSSTVRRSAPVSPIERDRAREKRRYEKHQAKLERRQVEARRNKQVLGIVLAMLLVIGGFVGVSLALSKDGKTLASGQPTCLLYTSDAADE